MAKPDATWGGYGKTVHAEDGLKHIVKVNGETNRGFNGWHYYFECGADVGYMTRGTMTDEAPTCLTCIDKHRGC
jgi:hypothetical protein